MGLRCKHPGLMTIGNRHAFLQATGQLTIMDSQSPANTIRSILSQVQTTDIDIGSHTGHFISSNQVQAILNALELGHSKVAPPTEVALLLERARENNRQIQEKQIELERAPKKERARVNEELGELLSQRARIDKAVAKASQNAV